MARLPFTASLSDGTRVEIRALRPEDKDELRQAFERLSPRSRFSRFLGAKRELGDDDLQRLTDVDGRDHVAVVAVVVSPDLKTERGLGIGRFVRLPPGDVAEGAVTVADEAQNKGLGRILLATLAELAEELSIRAFRAEVLASNVPIRKLLDAAGAKVIEDHGETLVLEVAISPLPDASDRGGSHPMRRILRAVAMALNALHPPDDRA